MHSLKVLILEDHPFQLMTLHQMLNANGVFDVLTAESVPCAMQMLERRGAVDVAICDLYMDGPDGLAMIRHLAEQNLASALIVLSDADATLLDAMGELIPQLGLRLLGCIPKPASGAVLHRLLSEYRNSVSAPAVCAAPAQILELASLSAEQLALSRKQWKVRYQPRVNAEGVLAGVEASLRWQHPTLGQLAPGQFFTVQQGAALSEMLTWHGLEQALALSAAIRLEDGRPLPVAVSMPPTVLLDEGFVGTLRHLLLQHRLPAIALSLELAETHCAQLGEAQRQRLSRLRKLGCQLCLDGFGRGAANLQQLFDLPLSQLKLPGEFVRGMSEDGKKAGVVASALILARRSGLGVLVDDVDTLADWQAVQGLGRILVQGGFVGGRMSGGELLEWINARECSTKGQQGVA